jgi:TonB family protein
MKNYWNLAFGLSILVHSLFLVELFPFFQKQIIPSQQKFRPIEMFSQNIEKVVEEAQNTESLDSAPPPYIDDFISKMIAENEQQVSLQKPRIMEESLKEITLSEIPQEEYKNDRMDNELRKIPAYMEYYQLVRQKVRKNAYRYYDSRDEGEVFLNFAVSSNGRLKSLQLNRESKAGIVLQNIALRSVRAANPFPAFPSELNEYTLLNFNISIYFKSN